MIPSKFDKIEGMLIGSAIGDAAGGPVEFVDPPIRSFWSVTDKKLNNAGLEELVARFSIPAYSKVTEPFAQWGDFAPAGTITDDTRFKIIFFNALQKYGMELTQQQFAQEVLDFRQFLPEKYHKNYDAWIPEMAYATNCALGAEEGQGALPLDRIWGGIATMMGQMPFIPIAALNPADPEWCYRKCYELGYFDVGYGKDINSALIAGLARTLQSDGSWPNFEESMRQVDPYRYNETLYVSRQLTRWLDLAHDLVKQADGNVASLFTLLESELEAVYWWEAWVPIVVVLSVAEITDFHPLASLQLIIEFGHDTDSYAQVMGAVLGAIHGKAIFPQGMRDMVNNRMKEQYNQNIDDWMKILSFSGVR